MVTALHVLLAAAPGDAIDTVTSDPEIRRVLETQWGLAGPLHERIIATVQSLLVGDLGYSWTVQPGQSVASLLYQPAARSGALIAFSLSVTLMLGAGCIWIERRHKHVRPFISVVRTASLVPVFLIGLGSIGTINALTWYAIDAGWIHRPNFFALPIESSWVPLGLAAFTLGISSGMLNAVYLMFNDTLTTLDNSTFVLATKGQLQDPKIHYSRHLILQTMAMTTKRVPLMLGSLVIVDPVFNINGLGRALLLPQSTGTSRCYLGPLSSLQY